MALYEESLIVLQNLFARDYQFALATTHDNIPTVRFVDTFYDTGAFYIVTYAKSQKVSDITTNPRISMCNKLYRFSGNAFNIGHPLAEKNHAIRAALIHAFAPWYFAHNNEADEAMCYLRIDPIQGFFYKDGTGYSVDFEKKTAETFPFAADITFIE